MNYVKVISENVQPKQANTQNHPLFSQIREQFDLIIKQLEQITIEIYNITNSETQKIEEILGRSQKISSEFFKEIQEIYQELDSYRSKIQSSQQSIITETPTEIPEEIIHIPYIENGKEGFYDEIIQKADLVTNFKVKTIVECGNYTAGLREGPWIIKILESDRCGGGNYFRGQKVGQWADVQVACNKLAIYLVYGTYVNNVRHGNWSWESLSNRWRFKGGVYEMGVKVGKWAEIDHWENWYQGVYINGQRDGAWTISNYNQSKNLGYGTYQMGIKIGQWCEPHPENWNKYETGFYENGVRVGQWQTINRREQKQKQVNKY